MTVFKIKRVFLSVLDLLNFFPIFFQQLKAKKFPASCFQ